MAHRFQVGPGTVVHVRYRLFDGDGELCEESEPDVPLSFLFGYGQVSPAIEQALEGLASGQTRRVRLRPEQAFGSRRVEALLEVPRSELPDHASIGDEFEAEDEAGDVITLTVLELAEEYAVLDGNHPLAGQSVELELQVEAVRPADAMELMLAQEELEAQQSTSAGLLHSSRLLKDLAR